MLILGLILATLAALCGLWLWLSRETAHDKWLERLDSEDDYT